MTLILDLILTANSKLMLQVAFAMYTLCTTLELTS